MRAQAREERTKRQQDNENMGQVVKHSKSMAKGVGCAKVVREIKNKRKKEWAYKIQISTPT
jgi:hypothetical protein